MVQRGLPRIYVAQRIITYLDICGLAPLIVFRPKPAPEGDHWVDGGPSVPGGCWG
jgi:hypothetical protein